VEVGDVDVGAGVARRGDNDVALAAGVVDGVAQGGGGARAAPAVAGDAGAVIDGVADRLGRRKVAAVAVGAHELQGHDLGFPVDTHDAQGVVALRGDGAAGVRPVAVIVQRVVVAV